MKYKTLLPILVLTMLTTMIFASNVRLALADANITVQAQVIPSGLALVGVPVSKDGGAGGNTPVVIFFATGSHTIDVPKYYNDGNRQYVFSQWSDGVKSTTRTINVGTTDTTYTAQYRDHGPEAQSLLVHIFDSDVSEFQAFQSATGVGNAIDFTDWPLSKDYIENWQTAPYNSYISERAYSDIGIYEIDMNNQRWPCGVSTPRTYESDSASYKEYYGNNSVLDNEARLFRTAMSYLSDKNGWITRVLKGYGYALETAVPIPALSGWTDYAGLKTAGLLHDYNTLLAASTLDSAGFTQGTASNPYYDSSTAGSAAKLRIDPTTGTTLRTLDFYIRQDDVLRTGIGLELVNQMRKAGIQVNPVVTSRPVCYNQVMVIYDFDLYTAGWSLSADIPNSLWGLFHSSQYWGGTSTSYFGGVGWSGNYYGTCDQLQDNYLNMGYFGQILGDVNTPGSVYYGTIKGQERFCYLQPIIPAYARAAVQAFKTGWTGTINEKGVGPANYYSFLHAADNGTGSGTIQNPNWLGTGAAYEEPNEIDWGFKSGLSGPNPITSQWVWDSYIVGLMYDSMLARDPYDLSKDFGVMASSWTTLQVPTPPALPYIIFTLRSGNTFHDGSAVTPEDVKFSIEFTKACGPGVAWGYSTTVYIDHVSTQTDEPALGPLDVKVYFDKPSYWALHWSGYQAIYERNIWMAASAAYGWGYTRGMTNFNLFTNRALVRQYNPWLVSNEGNGKTDFQNDGCGPWIFDAYAPSGPISAATSVHFLPFAGYILSKSDVARYLAWSFGLSGDVNKDGNIDTIDGQIIAKALGTNSAMLPWGTGFDQYNPASDINTGSWDMINMKPASQGDGQVNFLDYYKWGFDYGNVP